MTVILKEETTGANVPLQTKNMDQNKMKQEAGILDEGYSDAQNQLDNALWHTLLKLFVDGQSFNIKLSTNSTLNSYV